MAPLSDFPKVLVLGIVDDLSRPLPFCLGRGLLEGGVSGLMVLVPGIAEVRSESAAFLVPPVLRSDPTPTFSHSAPSIYTPTYETPDTWDCITMVSDFPDVVPAHPLDILPCVAPEPVTLHSLMRCWPYTTHCFTKFRPRRTDGNYTELFLAPRGHFTHAHTLEHSTFCREHICPTHFPYGGNRLAK
jgi:hypothetical protein